MNMICCFFRNCIFSTSWTRNALKSPIKHFPLRGNETSWSFLTKNFPLRWHESCQNFLIKLFRCNVVLKNFESSTSWTWNSLEFSNYKPLPVCRRETCTSFQVKHFSLHWHDRGHENCFLIIFFRFVDMGFVRIY